MGAIIANLKGTELDAGIGNSNLATLNTYWENVRGLYVPFESGQLSGSSDVYNHEIPGGQYTNLLFQSKQLGLTSKWPEIKAKYAEADQLLGDIPKVTPSSKVVGDLAQFMVAQKLSAAQVLEQADTLSLPSSVVEYFQGVIGVPPGGFPEPLRSRVLKGRRLADGRVSFEGRPGATLRSYDFAYANKTLSDKYGFSNIRPQDVLSHALYPNAFTEWKDYELVYGEISQLPINLFLHPMRPGNEIEPQLEHGRDILVKLVSVGGANENGCRQVNLELNGERWFVPITDTIFFWHQEWANRT